MVINDVYERMHFPFTIDNESFDEASQAFEAVSQSNDILISQAVLYWYSVFEDFIVSVRDSDVHRSGF